MSVVIAGLFPASGSVCSALLLLDMHLCLRASYLRGYPAYAAYCRLHRRNHCARYIDTPQNVFTTMTGPNGGDRDRYPVRDADK